MMKAEKFLDKAHRAYASADQQPWMFLYRQNLLAAKRYAENALYYSSGDWWIISSAENLILKIENQLAESRGQ